MSSENEAVVLSAVRTPIGKFQGALTAIPATQLGAIAVKAAVARAGIDPEEIEEVIMGNVVQAGEGQAPARQAGMHGGIPATVGASTINKVCGSGLKAAMLSAQAIRAGDADLFVAGGFESMSRAPYLVTGRSGELKFGNQALTDALLNDGLWDPFENWGMGMAAEFIADEYEVTREAMDQFALRSHEKAVEAQEKGWFTAEIVPVQIAGRKGSVTEVTQDEGPRSDTTLEALSKLKPAFKANGKVSPGNSSQMSDGGAAVVIASRAYAKKHDLKPMARIVGYTQAAVEPKYLFAAPAYAMPKLLNKIGWTFADVDLIELNEAFAAQVLADGYALADQGWDWSKVNVHGGAIALGHPLGASGTRVLVTLLHALKNRGLKRGIASLCLGGGEAVAMAVEMEG
ncbi:MAG: acetyl-CoA C-acetyltransferase [Chloroflexi bacterium]|mgnify:CR=1 FL=1|nr:acetyl-CoA C-acetyltransferase [Chloroflexota bacterium]